MEYFKKGERELFQIPKASDRTIEVKSMCSDVSLPGFKSCLHHLVTVSLVSFFVK